MVLLRDGALSPSQDISVLIICYNQEQTIASAIQSVQAQTFQHRIREIIVVDDGSLDGSTEIIAQAAKHDDRISPVFRRSNSGAASVPRNDGLCRVGGDFVAFLDGDDEWTADKLEKIMPYFAKHAEVGLVYSNYSVRGANKTSKHRRPFRLHLGQSDQVALLFEKGGPIIPSATVVRRSVLDKAGDFDPDIPFVAESDLWLRCALVSKLLHHEGVTVRKREWYGSRGSRKYGLEKLTCKRVITRKIIAQEPRLKAQVNRREALITYKEALYHLSDGQRVIGRALLRDALRLNPLQTKVWACLVAAYLPGNPNRALAAMRGARLGLLGLSDRARVLGHTATRLIRDLPSTPLKSTPAPQRSK